VPEDTVTQITIDFADSTTSPAALIVTAASSNPNVVAQSGLAIGPLPPNPTGGSRVLTITPRPNAVGIAVITLTLVDTDGAVTRGSFSFTTTAVNDPPTIEPIANITAGDAAPFSTPVIVSEIDGPMFSLTATSSNQALLPNANLVFSGFGLSRTLTMTPIAGLGGTTTVTVTVSDGLTSASRSFVATVVVAPQPPDLTSAVIDGAVAELEWAEATSGITPLAYQIEAGTAPGASSVVESITARARRFALTLPSNGTWFVRIRAVNGVALSPPSAEATLTSQVCLGARAI
jgi:Bacterial Ig domain